MKGLMKKRNVLKNGVILLAVFFLENFLPRVFLPPLIDQWYWYANTIEYPLEFYFYNRRKNFCWDVGVSFDSTFADRAIFTDQLIRGDNLAALFHGVSEFSLTDFLPITGNIAQGKGGYDFFPDYVFSQNSCQFNLQVSRDFEYEDEKYIRGTIRCIIPFLNQSVTNLASGNMFYNTDNYVRQQKEREKIEKIIKHSALLKREKAAEAQKLKSFPQDQVLVRQENGENVFAIQGSYIKDSLNNPSKDLIIDIDTSQISLPYMVINKNGLPADAVDGSFLTLDNICRSWSLLNQASNNTPYYGMVDGIVANDTVSSNGVNFLVVNNATFPTDQNSALLTLYSYPQQAAVNGLCAYGQYNLPYTILTEPNYIVDFSVGDLSTSADAMYGNGLTGDLIDQAVGPNIVPINTLIRLVATGNYGTYSTDADFPWNRQQVQFTVPPVIVQKSVGFPASFGISSILPNHPYCSGSTTGQQFQLYSDYLSQLGENTITLLNEDGSFLNPDAPYAVLWYANDYSNLFMNGSDSVLKNLYITSSLNPDDSAPTATSGIITRTIQNNEPEPPTPCCETLQQEIDELAEWTVTEVYEPLAAAINQNSEYLDNEIQNLWSLLSVTNNVIGNVSPLTASSGSENVTPMVQNPLASFLKKRDPLSRLVLKEYENGKWQSMRYNGFHDSGLGDLTLEFMVGSYFLNKKAVFDVFFGLDCPSASSINESSSYLAVGLGNNGHFVAKLGFQGFLDIDYLFRFRMSTRCYFEHAFAATEKLVPGLEGYPIFGIIPVKMDSSVSWNGGMVYVDGSLYANDFSGFTLGYQYWSKGQDNIRMISPSSISVPNMNSQNMSDGSLTEQPDFSELISISNRISHTISCNFFSRLTNECFVNGGMSRIVSGKHIPQIINFHLSLGLSY